jgi:uncharacterized membrane protein YfcA
MGFDFDFTSAPASGPGLLVLAVLGILAGVLTTLAGQGGGLFLLLAIGALGNAHEALALSSPALLLGNLHRAVLYRREASWGIAWRLAAGAVPAAVVGGAFAGRAPAVVIDGVLVALTAFAILRALGKIAFTVPQRAFPVAGAFVGFLTGTSGGAGVMISPLLLSTGLTGKRFVATSACVAFAIHVGRVAAYAKTGLVESHQLAGIAMVAAAIFAGNALANRTRRFLSSRASTVLEYGTLTVCVALSVFGLSR